VTTLSLLKTRIADDINRTDLTSQIADAITDAITHYKEQRFFFTETRSSTFATVATPTPQSTYISSDDADIPLFVEIDDVFLNDGTNERRLTWASPAEMQWLLDSSAASGRPYKYSYFEQSFRLYPIPDAVYTVRPIGVIEKAAPATDGEADNVWMTKAFELIRCRAKWYLCGHTIQDFEMVIAMGGNPNTPDGKNGEGGAVGAALQKLRRETAKKTYGGMIAATQF
jgi:hypothetical protein